MRQGTGSKRATKVGVLTTRLGSLLALISTFVFVFVFVTASDVSASAAPSAPGYWLEAGDGGWFSFGAPFHGSAASDATRCPANPPARSMPNVSCWSMGPTPDSGGCWILNGYRGVLY